MEHNKSYLLVILLSFSILHSCGLKSYNYPYAENNTTIDTIYDVEVTDEYQWLESDSDITRDRWLDQQKEFTNNYFSDLDINEALSDRINQLSSIPSYYMIGIRQDTLYYFRHQMNQDSIRLYKMSGNDFNPICINTYLHQFGSDNQINSASISKDGKYMAIPAWSADKSKYSIKISLLDQKQELLDTIPAIAYNQKVIWTHNGFFFVGSTEKANENEVYFYDLEHKKYKRIYNGKGILINTINLCLNDSEDKLIIAELSQIDDKLTISTYKIHGDNNEAEVAGELFIKNRNIKVLGYDAQNIYVCRPQKNNTDILAYNLKEKKWHKIYNIDQPVSSISFLRDHIVLIYQQNNKNIGRIIDKTTWTSQELNVPDEGYIDVISEKNNSSIYYLNESLIQPQVLYKTTLDNPKKISLVQSIDKLSFDPHDFMIEDIIVKDKHGNNMNIVLTYKKGVSKDGNNPLIYFDFSNGMGLFADKFFYTRIILLEQGFIFAHKRFDSPNSSLYLEDKSDEITGILNYLVDKKYTNPSYIALSGREYGATTIAHLINKKPDICKVALLNRGLYDFIRHRKLDEDLLPIDSTYRVNDEINFKQSLKVSPFHNIKIKAKYPAMILCTGKYDTGISPIHSYKYIAKLQMLTQGNDPLLILIKDKSTVERQNNFSDYNDELLLNYAFLFNNLNIPYSESNFSNKEK